MGYMDENDLDEMKTKVLDRLINWLTAQGMTPEKILDCIKYMSETSDPAVTTEE
jgi:CheY-specific phosphatase CheX